MSLDGAVVDSRNAARTVSFGIMTNPGAEFSEHQIEIGDDQVSQSWDYGYALRCVEVAGRT
jgi:hypothetical protein